MNRRKIKRDVEEFGKLMTGLNLVEFLGLARIYNVEPYEEDEDGKKVLRQAEDLINEILTEFAQTNATARYNMIHILRAASKGGDDDGSSTSD